MAKALELDHLQLAMPRGEEAAARTFYGDVLGLPEIPRPEPSAARGGVWFQCGLQQLHLGVEDDFRPAKKAHPAFLVNDLDAITRSLEAKGFQVIVDPVQSVEGRRVLTEDPFGNRVELTQKTGREPVSKGLFSPKMTSQAAVQKAKLQREASQFALDCTKSEYADLADTFKSLDSKAQGTVTLAGILVAAPFAFLKELSGMSPALPWLVSGTLIASLSTILCVLLALRVAEVAMPLSGSRAAVLAADASRDDLHDDNAEANREELMSAFLADVQQTWSQAVEDLRSKTLVKATWVARAQALAATSALLAAAAVAIRIW